MGYLGNYGGTFGESALTPASNHAEATLVVKILLIREIAVLVHGRFEVRLTAASLARAISGLITDEGVAVGGAFDSDTATGVMPVAHRGAGVLASRRS